MKNELKYLKATYLIAFLAIFLLAVYPQHATFRAIFLLVAFTPVVFVHVMILLRIENIANKLFRFLSVLWIVKIIIFTLDEGLNYFFQKNLLFLGILDLLMLLIISCMVSISFFVKNPFFYIKVENNIYKVLGVFALIMSGWITLQLVFVFIDFIRPG